MAKKNTVKEYFTQSYYFDKDELKKEYRRLSKQYHPDLGGSTAIMVAINREYEILLNQNNKSDKYKIMAPWTKAEVIEMLKQLDIDYILTDGKILARGKNVYDNKDALKNVYGFWWDAQNKYWYWTKAHSKQKVG